MRIINDEIKKEIKKEITPILNNFYFLIKDIAANQEIIISILKKMEGKNEL